MAKILSLQKKLKPEYHLAEWQEKMNLIQH